MDALFTSGQRFNLRLNWSISSELYWRRLLGKGEKFARCRKFLETSCRTWYNNKKYITLVPACSATLQCSSSQCRAITTEYFVLCCLGCVLSSGRACWLLNVLVPRCADSEPQIALIAEKGAGTKQFMQKWSNRAAPDTPVLLSVSKNVRTSADRIPALVELINFSKYGVPDKSMLKGRPVDGVLLLYDVSDPKSAQFDKLWTFFCKEVLASQQVVPPPAQQAMTFFPLLVVGCKADCLQAGAASPVSISCISCVVHCFL